MVVDKGVPEREGCVHMDLPPCRIPTAQVWRVSQGGARMCVRNGTTLVQGGVFPLAAPLALVANTLEIRCAPAITPSTDWVLPYDRDYTAGHIWAYLDVRIHGVDIYMRLCRCLCECIRHMGMGTAPPCMMVHGGR